MDNTPRILKVGDALSQLINVTFLPRHRETPANESVSGRSHRCGWRRLARIIDALASPWEKDHCRLSYERDIERAKALVKNEETK